MQDTYTPTANINTNSINYGPARIRTRIQSDEFVYIIYVQSTHTCEFNCVVELLASAYQKTSESFRIKEFVWTREIQKDTVISNAFLFVLSCCVLSANFPLISSSCARVKICKLENIKFIQLKNVNDSGNMCAVDISLSL